MKKLCFIVTAIMLIVSGCSGINGNKPSNLLELSQQYSALKEDLSGIADEQLASIKIPKYIPFQIKSVQAEVYSDDSSHIELIFTNGSVNLHITTMEQTVQERDSNDINQIKNIDSIAKFNQNHFGKEVQWNDPENDRVYILKLLRYSPQEGEPFTKEEILKIANSMYSKNINM